MPFNGTGTFTRLYSWQADATAGKVISPTEFDADGNDVAAALSLCITRDGQQTIASNIPWNGKRITNLGAPVNAGDALSLGSTPASETTRLMQSVAAGLNSSDFGANGSFYISTSINFVAIGSKLFAGGMLGVSHSGSSASIFYQYIDLYDNVAAGVVGASISGYVFLNSSVIPYGTITSVLSYSGLVNGRSYTLRLWQQRGTASGPSAWTSGLYGINV